jgi:hypothetical protein
MIERRAEILRVLRSLESWGHGSGWSGTDQYDGLNATRVPHFAVRTPLGRRVVIQAVKRCPLDLRPLLGVKPGVNAVSLAWVARAYAMNGFLPHADAARRLTQALDGLDRLRLDYEEPCWGYHFDFQSRVFFYPRSTPNSIATVFAGMAYLEAYERRGEVELLDVAHGVGRFFLRHVPQTRNSPGAFFGYLPGDRSPIHNSNLLTCALLSRVAVATRDEEMRAAAAAGVRWSVSRQHADGSWPYGESANLRWIDNFHTGYVLEALDVCARAGIAEAQEPLERGLAYYRTRLFLADGTPKYLANQTYPIDMWCVAQAIQTFSIASRLDRGFLDQALDVFAFALREMRGPDGLFVFQRRRLWRNPARHVRGVVAPMVLALSHLLARMPGDRVASGPLPQRLPVGAVSAGSIGSPASASTNAS